MQVRIIKEGLVINMDLKVGDLVEFKKYEDMTEEEHFGIKEEFFPEFGKVKIIDNDGCFRIEDSGYWFKTGSVDYIIVKAAKDDIHVGDEVLMKATIRKINGNHISFSWVNNNKGDVVEVLNHKEEHFIVQEDQYKMYVIDSKTLSLDKSKAKIYNSRIEANNEAADMHLNAWEVIPYE